ncbi:MAG: hypothetical protein KGJ78_18955, partial [Alphaproteobacteria bacterium]|nr:hypothetical protein [Alphaproteobacteria bacterium]
LHCDFTSPLYLALAALTLVVGFHLVWLGPQTWNLIGLAALLGWVLFSTIPKWIWGRYWIGRGKAPNR